MQKYKSKFLQTLFERDFVKQCTNVEGLDNELSNKSCVAYVGFDCTARSLHIGSLLQIMLVRWFQKCGHKPIIIMGGATTRIGDPSDKTEMRKMLTVEDIEENKKSLGRVFAKYLDFSESNPNGAIMVDNIEWLGDIKYLDFLRDYGQHFTINRMLTFESVKLRLEREQPLTFLEFNYMLLQAYDFVELNRRYGCILEFGGSEQWGNIVNGVELGRRVLNKEFFGITTNTILNSAGQKMGKTAQGAVWLNEDMLPAYDFWQFWRNVSDEDVIKFMKIYTEMPMEEIAEYAKLEGQALNEAKIRLADEVTAMCHSVEASEAAHNAATKLFGAGEISDDLPSIDIGEEDLNEGIVAYKLLVQTGLCKSGNEAKSLIQSGGVKINDNPITDPLTAVGLKNFEMDDKMKISVGKKKHCIVNLVK